MYIHSYIYEYVHTYKFLIPVFGSKEIIHISLPFLWKKVFPVYYVSHSPSVYSPQRVLDLHMDNTFNREYI